MENASKALLIAAGVAIGVLLLSLIVILSVTFGDLGREYAERMDFKYIQTFNSQFTKYENINLKAQDVMTLAKLVNEWNLTGTNEPISMTVNGHDYTTIDYNFLTDKNDEIDVVDNEIIYPTYTMTVQSLYESGRVREIRVTGV